MQFIFSTGSLYTYGVNRCFELAARAGFDGIELMLDQRWDTRQPAYLQRLIDQYQQPVVAVHSPFVRFVPGWPADESDRIARSVKLAEALEAQIVVHHLPLRLGWMWVRAGNRRFPLPTLSQRLPAAYCRWLTEVYGHFQAGTAVTLCLENMPARRWLGRRWNAYRWNSVAEIARFPTLTLDTTHLGTWNLDPVEVYRQLRAKVRHIHLSNFNGQEHRRPEDGYLRLDRFLAQVAATSYRGAICLELQPDALDAGQSEARVVELLAASLNRCRAWAVSPAS